MAYRRALGACDPSRLAEGVKQALNLFVAAGGDEYRLASRNRVRLYAYGAETWREYSTWPPPPVHANTSCICNLGAGSIRPSQMGLLLRAPLLTIRLIRRPRCMAHDCSARPSAQI